MSNKARRHKAKTRADKKSRHGNRPKRLRIEIVNYSSGRVRWR